MQSIEIHTEISVPCLELHYPLQREGNGACFCRTKKSKCFGQLNFKGGRRALNGDLSPWKNTQGINSSLASCLRSWPLCRHKAFGKLQNNLICRGKEPQIISNSCYTSSSPPNSHNPPQAETLCQASAKSPFLLSTPRNKGGSEAR